MASKQRRGPRNGNLRSRQQQRTAKRSLLPALEVPSSPFGDAVSEQQSPAALMPVDAEAKHLILQIIEDFILQIPLGTDRASTEIEAAVSAELLDLHLANYQLKERLVKWTSAAQELQELVQQQQHEMHQLHTTLQQQKQQHEQQQAAAPNVSAQLQHRQLETANAELQLQLQGATSRLREVEAAMQKVMEQQTLGVNLDASKLVVERDAANAALAEARSTAATAQQDTARLRRALLDAEIDTQRASVAADSARQKVAELEAELSRARAQTVAAKADAESHQHQLAAAESVAAASRAQLLEAQAALSKAQLEAAQVQQAADQRLAAVQLNCQGCNEKAGQIIDLQDELQGYKARTVRLELAVQHEQTANSGLVKGLEECRQDLEQAKAALAAAARARDQMFIQLHGRGTDGAAGMECEYADTYSMHRGPCDGMPVLALGMASHGAAPSPAKCATAWQQHASGEGLIQKCNHMELQLQTKDTELESLRQQLLELQLQLSDAQSAAKIAQQQLDRAKADLEMAKADVAEWSAKAKEAGVVTEQAKHELAQLQVQVAQQASEVTTKQAQVDKLQAQQKVLLGDLKESMDAIAEATACQATASAQAEGLQKKLGEQQAQLDTERQQWKSVERQLTEEKQQLIQQLSAAEATTRTALEQASLQHKQQLNCLVAEHTARVDMLRKELAADGTRRAALEGKLQAEQTEHARQLAEAQAETQQARSQHQALQTALDSRQSELQQVQQKLVAGQEALLAAKAEAQEQLAAAMKGQQALRQQLLEVRGERLQLQDKLALLQSSSGSNQQLMQQMLTAQQDASAVSATLQQQLQRSHEQVQKLQADVQAIMDEKTMLEGRLAEAVAAKEAAARQAAAAGEKLAAAVAAHEATKLQIEAVSRDAARHSWDQQQHHQLHSSPAWGQQQQQSYSASAAGSYCLSPQPGSPGRAGQLDRSRQQLSQLAQSLAERDAELAMLNAKLAQAEAENQQLCEKVQGLKTELFVGHKYGTASKLAEVQCGLQPLWTTTAGSSWDHAFAASKLQYAVAKLAQLTQTMEALEGRLRHQAAMNITATSYSSPSPAAEPALANQVGSPVGRSHALAAAACAVADLRRDIRRLSSKLREEERAEQLQQKVNGVPQPVQQVQSLRNMVRQLSAELTEKESLLASVPEMQQQIAELSGQLAVKQQEAADTSLLQQQLAEMRQQLAAAREQAQAAAAVTNTDSGHLHEPDLRLQIEELQQQLAAVQAEAKAMAAAAAAASAGSNSRDESTLQTLLTELMQLKAQLDAATARDAGAAAEAAQLKDTVSDLQQRLQAAQQNTMQLEAARAAAKAAAEEQERLQTELRFLQRQFEEVTADVHSKEEQLQLSKLQVQELQQQLATLQTQSSAEVHLLKQQLQEMQANDTAARSKLDSAKQQIQQLHQQLQEQQHQVQQAQADELSGTARRMQTLLVQKDRDIQKLQQQLMEQQQLTEQLAEQVHKLQLQQSLPPSGRPSTAGATAGADSKRSTDSSSVAPFSASTMSKGEFHSNDRGSSGVYASESSRRSTTADGSMAGKRSWSVESAAAGQQLLNVVQQQGQHLLRNAIADGPERQPISSTTASGAYSSSSSSRKGADASAQLVYVNAASQLEVSSRLERLMKVQSGNELTQESSPAMQPPPPRQQQQQQAAVSAPGSHRSSSTGRQQLEGLGGLDPTHIERSLRSTSSGRSSNGTADTRGSCDTSSKHAPERMDSGSRPISLAASRAQSIGMDMPSPSLFPGAAADVAPQALRRTTSSIRSGGSGVSASSRSSVQGAANVTAVSNLQLQLPSPNEQQRSESSSPSKRAAAALAAQGLNRLPSRSTTSAAAGVTQHSRSGSLRWEGEASPAAAQAQEQGGVRASALLQSSTEASTAASRAMSRQQSRSAAAHISTSNGTGGNEHDAVGMRNTVNISAATRAAEAGGRSTTRQSDAEAAFLQGQRSTELQQSQVQQKQEMMENSSRAKLLAAAMGGYDVQKLRKSLSAKSRELPAKDRPGSTTATGSGSSFRPRAVSNPGPCMAVEIGNCSFPPDAAGSATAATGQQPGRASVPYLKPALSRAARVAGVMAGVSERKLVKGVVSFKEPGKGADGAVSDSSDDADMVAVAAGAGITEGTNQANVVTVSNASRASIQRLSSSGSNRRSTALQTAARLLEASDSD